MPTLDEILDGEVGPRWKAKGRGQMLVPEQMLRQWRLHPREMYKIFQLFEESMNNDGFRYEAITPDLLLGKLPMIMHRTWFEAMNKGWVVGEIPPFRFEQNSINPSHIGLVWEGRMVSVNFDPDG